MTGIQPVIILGMHRSGTSLVTNLLEQLGLFVGWRKDPNNEAMLFLRLNEWMLRQCGGAWDQPAPMRLLHRDRQIRSLTVDYLRSRMSDLKVAGYLGPAWRPWRRSLLAMDRPWGWKDPRNTFTLPIWQDLFPGAKAIHVYRHGLDVASSLRSRRQRTMRSGTIASRLWPLPTRVLQRPRFVDSVRCGDLEGGLSLWEEYMAEAKAAVGALGSLGIEVRYEDLLADPRDLLDTLVEFCGLDIEAKDIASVADRIRGDRALAFRKDPELADMARVAESRLAVFGY